MCLLDETSNMMTSSTTQRQIQNLIFHKLLQKPVKKRGLNHTVNIFRLPCKHSLNNNTEKRHAIKTRKCGSIKYVKGYVLTVPCACTFPPVGGVGAITLSVCQLVLIA